MSAISIAFVDDHPILLEGIVSVFSKSNDLKIVAKGYSVVDLNLGYQWKNWDFGIAVQNLFDTDWNETQFATETRLDFEPEPVEEIHFTPGTPFFLKGIVSYSF